MFVCPDMEIGIQWIQELAFKRNGYLHSKESRMGVRRNGNISHYNYCLESADDTHDMHAYLLNELAHYMTTSFNDKYIPQRKMSYTKEAAASCTSLNE